MDEKWKTITIALVVLFVEDYIWGFLIHKEYESKIGGYIENAYEVNTPDKFVSNLKSAKQGMINEGLNESDYGDLIFKRPDNSMKFQYEFLDSMVKRGESVEQWYNLTYSNKTTTTEQLGDVYEQKMYNLREFLIENGRADWIAEQTWLIKHYPIKAYINLISWILIPAAIIAFFKASRFVMGKSAEKK